MKEQFYIFADCKLVEVTCSLARATDVAKALRERHGGHLADKVTVKSYMVDVSEVQAASDRYDEIVSNASGYYFQSGQYPWGPRPLCLRLTLAY